MRDSLVEILKQSPFEEFTFGDYYSTGTIEKVADNLFNNNVTALPCKVGDIVYKICPKCNPNHNGSCEHCAWCSCHMMGCDVGVGVMCDGSYSDYDLQVIPYKVTERRFITIIKYWDLMFFSNTEEAEKAKNEYDEIRSIEDRKERYEKYKLWKADREKHYSLLGGDE